MNYVEPTGWDCMAADAPYARKTGDAAGNRIVFIDEYHVTWGPWSQWYSINGWFNQPNAQHSKGTTFSFADGHSDYHKWKDEFTYEIATMDYWDYVAQYGGMTAAMPPVDEVEDLIWAQKAMWGEIGW